ncbi:MAG TPA: DOMON-like domain-containing protein [Xanthobacteraceae bacterium]|nr:DOMON-like domain-containing protein [Xanthobacteraceae bacterium]
MRRALKLHPDSRCAAAVGVAVDVARSGSSNLVLRYVVTGRMSELSIPPLAALRRADELWRHTCFEAFLRALADETYYEFNFAPSRQWAAYRFTGYRTGMSVAHECPAPQIEALADPACCEVRVSLDLEPLSGLSRHAPWRLALAAVIEDLRGGRSYWALAHPPGKPDFHHPDGFVHELPAVVYS